MAVTYGFFNSVNGDRKYNAEQMSEYFRGIINEGVYQHLDGGLAVTAGTGLAVNVAAGRAIIQNRWVQNSAAMSLTIAAASETYARKDAVVIRLNWSSRSISIAVKTGTPAASPVAPSMTRNSTTYEMALAYVNVAANATSVTVTDKRSDSTVCGWVTVAQSTSGEVDQMLNDMKTGFDGGTYASPAAAVRGSDQKLQDEIKLMGFQPVLTTWEQGSIHGTTGEDTPSTSICRTVGYFSPTKNCHLIVVNPNNQGLISRIYDNEGTYIDYALITTETYELVAGNRYRFLCSSTGTPSAVKIRLYDSEESTFDYVNQQIEKNFTCIRQYDELIYSDFKNTYAVNYGWPGESAWIYSVGNHIVVPVKPNRYYKIKASSIAATFYYLVKSYTKPTSASTPIDFCNGETRRHTMLTGTTELLKTPSDCNYIVFSNINIANNYDTCPQSVQDKPLEEIYGDLDFGANGSVVKNITFDTPITILSNTDEEATDLDSAGITFFNIIQQSENMYYMYYTAWNSNGASDYTQNFLFAYSTDGFTYTRGFPSGIEPPFPGTNRLFSDDSTVNVTGQFVFKCSDPAYPYRMIVQQSENSTHHINMYKSTDGINFDLSTKRTLRYEFHDTQNVAVCRDNIIKLYSRENVYITIDGVQHKSREVSVMYFDLDGNKLLPPKNLPIQFIYNSAAMPITNDVDLILPTHFDNTEVGGVKDESYSVSVYEVREAKVKEVLSNVNTIFGSDDKFAVFVPTMLTIDGDQYLAFRVQNKEHDSTVVGGDYISEARIVKVTMTV